MAAGGGGVGGGGLLAGGGVWLGGVPAESPPPPPPPQPVSTKAKAPSASQYLKPMRIGAPSFIKSSTGQAKALCNRRAIGP